MNLFIVVVSLHHTIIMLVHPISFYEITFQAFLQLHQCRIQLLENDNTATTKLL